MSLVDDTINKVWQTISNSKGEQAFNRGIVSLSIPNTVECSCEKIALAQANIHFIQPLNIFITDFAKHIKNVKDLSQYKNYKTASKETFEELRPCAKALQIEKEIESIFKDADKVTKSTLTKFQNNIDALVKPIKSNLEMRRKFFKH